MVNECTQIIDVDLHNHTSFSDGDHSPEELIDIAKSIGLRAIGITDHDTISGLPAALCAGKSQGLEVICGIELTIRFTESLFTGSLHLLLYFSAELLNEHSFRSQTDHVLSLGRGAALTTARINAINQWFGPDGNESILPRKLEETDIYQHGQQISRRHFALALEEIGVADQTVISRIIGNHSPAYIPSGTPLESLQLYLNAWPLIRILAHPAAGSYPTDSHYKEVLPPFHIVEKLMPRFMDAGIDGLEIYYPAHTDEWVNNLEKWRLKLGLPLATGGSDSHDSIRRPLGVCGVPYRVVEQMKEMWKRKASRLSYSSEQ